VTTISTRLFATGERAAPAMVRIAVDRASLRARVVNPLEIGLVVPSSSLDSNLVSADACARYCRSLRCSWGSSSIKRILALMRRGRTRAFTQTVALSDRDVLNRGDLCWSSEH
jgi:hypothetical protein